MLMFSTFVGTHEQPADTELLAFRRLVYRFSQKLNKEEQRILVYIRLYDWKERYWDADTLDVLCRLETDCVFSPKNPEGLIEVANDINRFDLKTMVKDFMKKQRKERASSKVAVKAVMSFDSKSPVSSTELQLKAICEVTLSQTAVLVKQVDNLLQAIAAGTKNLMQRVTKAIRDAGCTAQALSEHLQKAQRELKHSSHSSALSLQRNSSGSEEDYYKPQLSKPVYSSLAII